MVNQELVEIAILGVMVVASGVFLGMLVLRIFTMFVDFFISVTLRAALFVVPRPIHDWCWRKDRCHRDKEVGVGKVETLGALGLSELPSTKAQKEPE